MKEKLEMLGLSIHTSKNTADILGDQYITGMRFSDNSQLDVEMLVISAGIKPRDELAKQAGLPTCDRGGIVVDEKLTTADPFIFAIGECALYNEMIYGLVAPGYEMAEVVVTNLTRSINLLRTMKYLTSWVQEMAVNCANHLLLLF